jgi:hypothetical protein
MSSVAPVTDRLNIPWVAGAASAAGRRRLFLSPVGLVLLGVILFAVSFALFDWLAELLWFQALG